MNVSRNRRHEGIAHLLNLHFIREGKLDPKFSKLFARLQKYRQEADYDPAVVFSQADVEEELSMALEFADEITRHLKKEGYLPND